MFRLFLPILVVSLILLCSNPSTQGEDPPASADTTPAPTSSATSTTTADDEDPFKTSLKWAAFVSNAEVIVAGSKAILKTLVDSLSDSNAGMTAGKKEYLKNYTKQFGELFRALPEYFEPLHEQLVDSAAYSKINPAIGLAEMATLNALAKTKPEDITEKTKLKWMEVNAMAITVHHIFDRMYDLFDSYGLEEIEALKIKYPTWTVENTANEGNETFEMLSADELIEAIHTSISAFGDKDHLFRGLERLLRQKLPKTDPSSTDFNFYCFGNNEFGLIHDSFDLLTDAALFLVMADIKYSALKVITEIFKQWDSLTNEKPGDLEVQHKAIIKILMDRVERKIKFSPLVEVPPDTVITGPVTFKCDQPPKPIDLTKGPIITSDVFPPGIYIQNNTAYNPDGKPLNSDPTGLPLLDNGTLLPTELRPIWQGPEGPIPTPKLNDKGEPINDDGTPITPAPTKVNLLIPIDSKTPKLTNPDYPMSEWGLPPPKGLTPRSNGLEPPLDPQTGPNITDGYLDDRKPNLIAAQFARSYSGYLEAEQVLNADGSCSGTCKDYLHSTKTCANKTDHCGTFRNAVCEPGKNCLEKSNCPNMARRCISTGAEVKFCPSSGNQSLYDWVNIRGKVIGVDAKNETKECGTEVQTAHERWEMEFGVIMQSPQYCEICLCVCEDPLVPDGYNYFNIEEMTSNITGGYVITAVKFDKRNNTILMMIEEGKMIGDGSVESSSVRWLEKEVNKDKNILLGPGGFKKMNLDTVLGKPMEVVTGLRFKQIDDALQMEVQFTKLDQRGLIPEGTVSDWRTNEKNLNLTRVPIDLSQAGTPAEQIGPSQPFHIPDGTKTVEFDASSLEKDAGGAVVPWFDLQPVQHYAGKRGFTSFSLIYKSKKGSGGFIAPAVTVYRKVYS